MTAERNVDTVSGWLMLLVVLTLGLGGVALIIISAAYGSDSGPLWWALITGILAVTAFGFLTPGFFTLQPNEARVLILFGAYRGTTRRVGFRWANPFYSNGPAGGSGGAPATKKKHEGESTAESQAAKRRLRRYKISLRARTLNMERLKVNDKRGNPVEIAAVVIWRVENTAQAVFDVDDFESYVATQSETALRHLASAYAYDHREGDDETSGEITLRSNVEDVSLALRNELQERAQQAGVMVEQAWLTHLAYSPEIAQAMLRRQQAEAIIAARRKIVTGAVSMVEMALHDLGERHVVELDEERKAAMISNLMVVLCGEAEVHPVVNTGTLYV